MRARLFAFVLLIVGAALMAQTRRSAFGDDKGASTGRGKARYEKLDAGASASGGGAQPPSAGYQFEFAPYDGGGMGPGACDCSNVASAAGAAVTFTRAGNTTCLKHSWNQNIAAGDLVTCGANKPAIMPGGANGAGPNGILIERSGTSRVLRSEEIGNAVWIPTGVISAAPTVTTDFDVAPDGTTSAERVQFADCSTAASSSYLTQPITITTGVTSQSVFLRSVDGGVQYVSLCTYDSTALAGTCTKFAVDAGWSRPMRDTVTISNATAAWEIGCNNTPLVYTGASSTGAADLMVWGAHFETPPTNFGWNTSYIKTTGASQGRASTQASVSVTIPADGGQWYRSITEVKEAATLGAGPVLMNWYVDGTHQDTAYFPSGTFDIYWANGGASTYNTGLAPVFNASNSHAWFYDGSSKMYGCLNGSCVSHTFGALTAQTGTATLRIGSDFDYTLPADGVVKLVCFDNRGDAGLGSVCP